MTTRYFLLNAFLFCLLALPVLADEVKEIRFAEHPGFTRAVVELDVLGDYKVGNYSKDHSTVTVEFDGVLKGPQAAMLTGKETRVTDHRISTSSHNRKLFFHMKTRGEVRIEETTLSNPARLVLDVYDDLARQTAAAYPGPVSPARRPLIVVVDPGHGGYHKGGVGKLRGRTVYEKQITISVAEKLEIHLKRDPRFEPRLTRRDDVYVGLQERTDRAMKLNGDLFISIHTNAVEGKAAQRRARGFELWTWSNDSNNRTAAKALERLENHDPGMKKSDARPLFTHLMIDALESQSLESRKVAVAFEGAFLQDRYFREHYRGIDSARFKVLENYEMPSVLVELGFITHPEEVHKLMDPAFQERCARYLYEGIVAYYETKSGASQNLAAQRR